MEYHGCFWHGCPKWYKKHTFSTVNKLSMADLYYQTMEKKLHIEKQGFTYSCKWECEFDKEIREDINIKRCVESIDIVTPLEPRDAFSGG
jgi:G:T-mismatch repair DNA endonuclease (very short patch repair protein)